MNVKTPLVSVLMPVRDGEIFVEAAVRSILGQSYTDFEFIIVDDGSSDATLSILERLAGEDHRIALISQPPQGIKIALNRGLSVARGKWIARMDADDIALPDRLIHQVERLNANSDLVGVGGQSWAIDPEGEILYPIEVPLRSKEIEESLMRGKNCLSHPTMVLRLEAVRKAGAYLDEYPTDDYGLWLRLLEFGRFENLPQFILLYRVHATASSITKHRTQRTAATRIVNEIRASRGLPPIDDPPADNAPTSVARIHHHWAMSAARSDRWRATRKHAIRSVRLEPWRLHAWWTFIKGVLHIRRLFF